MNKFKIITDIKKCTMTTSFQRLQYNLIAHVIQYVSNDSNVTNELDA